MLFSFPFVFVDPVSASLLVHVVNCEWSLTRFCGSTVAESSSVALSCLAGSAELQEGGATGCELLASMRKMNVEALAHVI